VGVVEIALVDAVAVVRDELLAAAARGTGAQVEFAVGEVVLEFEVELRKDTTTKAGFSAWVVSGDWERSGGRGSTQRVSVTLHPRSKGGGDVLIAGDEGRADGPGDVGGHIGR
jgi:hypothetical protein